jgi:hypothetical protein
MYCGHQLRFALARGVMTRRVTCQDPVPVGHSSDSAEEGNSGTVCALKSIMEMLSVARGRGKTQDYWLRQE